MATKNVQRCRGSGFTLVELMIVIAVLGIIAAIAIPQFNTWLVRSRIQAASGRLQQDMAWAEGYAIRSGYPVQVQIRGGIGTPCSWTITPAAPNVSQAIPQMTAADFANLFPNTVCTVLTGATTSNIVNIGPTGMTYDGRGAITSAAVTFGTTGNDAASYGYWLVQLSGAGNLRNCATSAPTSSVCNLQ